MINHPDLPADAPQWLKDADVERPEWRGGVWHDGEWCGGLWRGGVWNGGVWHDGVWQDGEWHGGVWHGKEDRLLYMASILGIVFDESGMARAYRTTLANGHGRHYRDFVQQAGSFVIADAKPAGTGTCCAGLHVTSAAIAHTYFGVDYSAQMWAVDFHRYDLLDCDGQKARIRAGCAMPIDNPFLPKESK